MRNSFVNNIKILVALSGFVITLASCSYKEIVDADYPDQKIYMPAAVNGNYIIAGVSPANKPFRYVVDMAAKKFNVPLSVYRSGINNNGGFTVDIKVDTDTITRMIDASILTGTLLLPADKYTIESAVDMAGGKEWAPFTLSVDLDFLRNNPGQLYALCVGVSSPQKEVNPANCKTIIIIDPKITLPVAGFTSTPVEDDPNTIQFTNTSAYALEYSWDFGDGGKADVPSPAHTYTTAGTYTVKLTVTGITGEENKSTMDATVTIP
ncbi:PKD domain-containing protein [Chitinophaga sp. MM2321]|uniref:PKD domain-containing protein n=1 Tax=Chitinophaga sp. MM2321 TaxID=3137178 RepID=UPI0032D593B3